jgi:iron complex outermembrane receptor protein
MLDGAIQAVDAQTKLNNCNESGDMSSEACSGMQRSSTGEFVLFDNQLENLGNIDTAGFDFSANWASPVTFVGTFTANLSATYADYYRSTDAEGNLQPRIVSIETANSVISRLKSNLRLGWRYRSWLVDTTLRFISAANENCASAAKFPICDTNIKTPQRPQGTHRLASTTYQDLRVSWKVPTSLDLTLTAGINNLWNKWPPICVSCTLNGYDASTYDLPSRFTYVQASLNF